MENVVKLIDIRLRSLNQHARKWIEWMEEGWKKITQPYVTERDQFGVLVGATRPEP